MQLRLLLALFVGFPVVTGPEDSWAGPPPTALPPPPGEKPRPTEQGPRDSTATTSPPGPTGSPTSAPAPSRPPASSVPDPFSEPAAADMSPTTDLTRTWGYSKGGPEKPNYVRMGPEQVTATPNPLGFYSGVSVQAPGTVPPWAPKDTSGAAPMLTWTGFTATPPGRSQVFFQLTKTIDHQLSQQGLRVTVRMPGTKVNVKNNTRPLDLTWFRTPVKRVTVRMEGGDAVATIELKRAATAASRLTPAENGYLLLVIEFAEPAEH